jgi:hypothetical protein
MPRFEPKAAIAVDLVVDLDGWEDQRNRCGCKHVVLADLGPANQRVEAQTLGNSNARGRIDEDHGLPGANVGRADREGAKRAGPDVSPELAPANVLADEGGERPGVEHSARLTGSTEEHPIETRRLAKTKPQHMRQLELGPNGDELLHRARNVADRRRDECAVDRTDARAGDQVDLGCVTSPVGELAEDVLEDPDLVSPSRAASRKYQAKTTQRSSSSFKGIS